jgi:hypothetical protein
MPQYFDPMQSMNALAGGAQMGGAIRQTQTQNALAPMVAKGDYKGAMEYAGSRGDLGQVDAMRTQYEAQIAQMGAEERSAAAQKADSLARIAMGGLQQPEQNLGAYIQQNAPSLMQNGITQEQIAQWAQGGLTHQALQGFVNDVTPMAEMLKMQQPFMAGDKRIDPRTNTVIADFGDPDQRRIVKGPDGYDYYEDTQERVLPNVQAPRKAPERETPGETRPVSLGEGQYATYNPESQRWDVSGGGGGFDAGAGGFGYTPPPSSQGGFIQAAFDTGGGEPSNDFRGIPYAPDAQTSGPALPNMKQAEYDKYRGSSLAKADTEELSDARAASMKFSKTIQPRLDTMKAMIDQGIPMGPMSGVGESIGSYAPALQGRAGVPSGDEIARRRAFDATAKQLTIDMASIGKGAMSDSDRVFFEGMAPQLINTEDGARLVIDALERQGQRNQEYADGAEIWSTNYGGLSMPNEEGKTFIQKWTQYASENPIVPSTHGEQTGGRVMRINDAAGYASVPSGSEYIAPDGIKRRKQ